MRTKITEQHYLKRAENLYRQAKIEGGSDNLSHTQIIQLIINKQAKIAKSTWRQYKASLIFYLEKLREETYIDYDDITLALNLLNKALPTFCMKKGQSTSAHKQKKISDGELTKLINHALTKETRYGSSAITWLLASITTGLRPCEWKYAVINDLNSLIIVNAKSTNNRAHGETRSINLNSLTAIEKEAIQKHLSYIQNAKHSMGFEKYYACCRSALYELTRSIWPHKKNQITLYSARHQFAANAKKNGLLLEEIAALMGHASIETATSHYGRRSSGKPNGTNVSACIEDINRVKTLNAHRTLGSFSSKNTSSFTTTKFN